jgi:hypothetical protein
MASSSPVKRSEIRYYREQLARRDILCVRLEIFDPDKISRAP